MSTFSAELYVAWNEDGDFCADSDRDTAIERLTEEYGGHLVQVTCLTLNLPEPRDLPGATVDIKPEAAEAVTVEG